MNDEEETVLFEIHLLFVINLAFHYFFCFGLNALVVVNIWLKLRKFIIFFMI